MKIKIKPAAILPQNYKLIIIILFLLVTAVLVAAPMNVVIELFSANG